MEFKCMYMDLFIGIRRKLLTFCWWYNNLMINFYKDPFIQEMETSFFFWAVLKLYRKFFWRIYKNYQNLDVTVNS